MTTRAARVKKRLLPDPALVEMEALESARDNLAPDEAIRQGACITNRIATMWRGKLVATPLDLYDVLRALIAKKVPFVLTGAHSIQGYTGRPRGTKDVDILAKSGRNHLRAVNALKEAFPELEVRALHRVTAFFRPGETESVIDVSLPHRKDNAESLVDTVWVDDKKNGVRYRIPSLECALANKYGSMLAVTRQSRKRRQDILDFEWMVAHSTEAGRTPIDRDRLETLGSMVWAEGGGKEIIRLVEMVLANEPITLESLGLP
jgi:hypothetical protein